jgi:long-chain acyl-CoA synthetase
VQPDDLATLIYTSGTTGNPKGVMLTHRNFTSNLEGAARAFPVNEDDVVLSYLPLSHSYERTAGYYTCFAAGATIAFADSIETVARDLAEVQPTLMTSVPILFSRIKGRIEKGVAAGPASKARMFRWALGVSLAYVRARMKGSAGALLKAQHAAADKVVMSKLRERIGLTRMRFFVSGGGPLPADVAEFFFAIGVKIIEGYGLTETSPILSANPVDKPKIGSVGVPLFNVEIRIADDGEILARGPNIMRGYFNDPDATAETIDGNGWLHTGDIGRFDDDGYLRITDRKKNLFVSSGGKNIAPQPIENTIAESRLIDMVMLIGDARPYLTALIVPDYETIAEIAVAGGATVGDLTTPEGRAGLIDSDPVALAIDADLKRAQRDLAAYERVRRFELLSEPFTVENGMLTPTLKVKRRVVEERYRDLIESMYAEEG